jgi:hypothetical protein
VTSTPTTATTVSSTTTTFTSTTTTPQSQALVAGDVAGPRHDDDDPTAPNGPNDASFGPRYFFILFSYFILLTKIVFTIQELSIYYRRQRRLGHHHHRFHHHLVTWQAHDTMTTTTDNTTTTTTTHGPWHNDDPQHNDDDPIVIVSTAQTTRSTRRLGFGMFSLKINLFKYLNSKYRQRCERHPITTTTILSPARGDMAGPWPRQPHHLNSPNDAFDASFGLWYVFFFLN